MTKFEKELIEDAEISEVAAVSSYAKDELHDVWIEDTDLTPYLTKFAILQRAREAAKYIPIYQVAKRKERGWYWADVRKEDYDTEPRSDFKRIVYHRSINETKQDKT